MELSDYTAALKELILPYIRDNYPSNTILLDQFKRNVNTEVINDEFVAPVRTSRHGGVGNLADDGNSVVSSRGARTGRGTVPVKITYGAFDISKLSIDASDSNTKAVENALNHQTKTMTSDFSRNLNRQYMSDGVGVISQVLGSVSGTEASVTRPDASLDDGRSIDNYGSVNGDIDPMKYIFPDQVLGIGTGGAADGTVAAVTGTSVQFTGTLTIAANDAIYIEDGSGEGAGTAEIQGIRRALSSSTGTSLYAGLARSTQGWAPQIGTALESLTQSRMVTTYIGAKEFSEGNEKYAIFVNKTLYGKYGDILTSMRRTVNETDLLGGWTGLEFAAGGGKVGVFLDYEVPDGEVLIINLDSWTICQVKDIDWVDSGAGNLLRLQNTIKYQAIMVLFTNLFCLGPASNGRLTQKKN